MAVVWCRGDAGPMTLNLNSAVLSLTVVAMAMRTISRHPMCAQTFVVSAMAAMCTGPKIVSVDHVRFKNTKNLSKSPSFESLNSRRIIECNESVSVAVAKAGKKGGVPFSARDRRLSTQCQD